MEEVVGTASMLCKFASGSRTAKSKETGRLAPGAAAYAPPAWSAPKLGTSLPSMASLPRSARLLRALVVVTCLVPLVQACGGRSDTEDYLFGSDGTITTGASTGTAGRGSTGGGTRAVSGGASSTA